MSTLFFRLLQHDDKPAALAEAVDALCSGQPPRDVYELDPESLRGVPGSPFAYWVSAKVRGLFHALPSFKRQGRDVLVGGQTSDDFKFLRLYWEVSYSSKKKWVPFYKGGNNEPYYDETRLLVAWDTERSTFDEFYGRLGRTNPKPSNYDKFFRPGLAYPYLPHKRGHFSHVPPGGVFGHASPMVQLPSEVHWQTCAILNSIPFVSLLPLLMARGTGGGQTLKYEVGYVAAVPIPLLEADTSLKLATIALHSYELARAKASANETSHVCHLPALLQVPGVTLANRVASWNSRVAETDRQLAEHQREIDDIAFRLYGIEGEDRALLEGPEATPLSCTEGESEPSEEDEP